MRSLCRATLVCLIFTTALTGFNIEKDYPITPVTFEKVSVDDSFWSPRIEVNRTVTIPYAFKMSEETGRIDNFNVASEVNAGKIKHGEFCSQYPFDDSDVFKIMEGAAYSLSVHPDPELEAYLDQLIATVANAQEEDGYLYTARTVNSEKEIRWVDGPRWSRTDHGHELYNVGHMYEAAVAHYLTTGKRTFLDIATKNADLVDNVFGPNAKRAIPGHEEIEIGLAKLYRATGEERYLNLAKFFLDERGHANNRELNGAYCQDHIPVIEQSEAVGHAVRAAYLYTGMADVAALTGDTDYINAIDRIWEDVVSSKLYLTGGIGATSSGEAFGDAYQLPNMSAYAETCAAIGNVLWNYRMFLLHGDAKYMDVLERSLYNGMLSGISLHGNRFFYPNPLASNKDGRERSAWFGCSCCPSNITRFIASVPGYIYAHRDNEVFVSLFMGSETTLQLNNNDVTITQSTDYPWNNRVTINVNPQSEMEFALNIRVPGWARNQPVPSDLYRYQKKNRQSTIIRINGKNHRYSLESGYAKINRTWKANDTIEVILPMSVRRVISHEEIKENQDKIALEYGPLVFCVEWPDYDASVFNLVVPNMAKLSADFHPNFLGGMTLLYGKGHSLKQAVYRNKMRKTRRPFYAIPYYAWAHRGKGEMSVWLAQNDSVATPILKPTIASESNVSYSFKREQGENQLSPDALNDRIKPTNSNDQSVARFHWWPHKGTDEWVQYDFSQETSVSSTSVYWFDDTGNGGCRVPKTWRVLYKAGDSWKPVLNATKMGVTKDQFNRMSFETVKTTALRLEVQLQDDVSGGILEWSVTE